MVSTHISPFQLLLLVLALLVLQISATNYKFVYQLPPAANDTTKSTYQGNLDLLLSSLSSNATTTGFFNDTRGQTSEPIYGLALCNGDISPNECQSCLNTSVQKMLQGRPHEKSSAIWYDECFMRYSNRSFFSSADSSFKVYLSNAENVSEVAQFNQMLGQLMDDLTKRAAYNSALMFATGAVNFTDFEKIYGSAQCTRDLTKDGCYSCLRDFVGFIPTCCDRKKGGRVLGYSCSIRFEEYPFYNVSATTQPSSSSQPPSSGTGDGTTSTPTHEGMSRSLLIPSSSSFSPETIKSFLMKMLVVKNQLINSPLLF